MTSRTRNLTILGIVAMLLVLALLVIVPGTPVSKDTKLGLDLEGGIELVYEGQATPQVPKVTPQAVDDAIETMRKRVDSLGVSEPEIQRAGAEPDLGRPARRPERGARQGAGRHHGAAAVLRLGAERTHRPRGLRRQQGPLSGRLRGHDAEGQGGGHRRPPGIRPDAGRGGQGQQHGQGPLLPVRPRPASDRPRQEAAAHRQLRAFEHLQGPARGLRRQRPARRRSTPATPSAWRSSTRSAREVRRPARG